MTVNTFRVQRLVSDKLHTILLRDQLVALIATHLLVRAMEWESGIPIMIEDQRIPARSSMTSTALGDDILRKLPAVLVVMAIGTCQTKRLQPKRLSLSSCLRCGMTLPAGN